MADSLLMLHRTRVHWVRLRGAAEKSGAMLITSLPIAVWLWGVASYGVAGNALGSIAAFVVPPVGVLHAIGVF